MSMTKREVRVLCWNVNGIRAIDRKGFLAWFYQEIPDILCLQEIKALPGDIPSSIENPEGYYAYWSAPQRKGYSGVATLSKEKPIEISTSLNNERFDIEGRVIISRYPQLTLFNVYFPNGKASVERLRYKMDFYKTFLSFIDTLQKKGEKLVVCGDFNTAHKEIDLARPRENKDISGFLPMERAWIDELIAHGFVDIFRYFNKDPNNYTWWSMRTRARERNTGWRIDYFFVSKNLLDSVIKASILSQVMGSDHCPIEIKLLV
jgi:exodeoxyribonuclease III